VARQFEEIKAGGLKYKDHSALLTWDRRQGTEPARHEPKVWDTVNEISKM